MSELKSDFNFIASKNMKERSTMMQAEEVSGEERKSFARRRPTAIQN